MALSRKKIFVFGIDRSGKTVTTNFLMSGETRTNYRPTTGFSLKKWEFHKVRFQMWDAPGQEAFRRLWIRGIRMADILIFILDTADKDRYSSAKFELERIIQELPENVAPLLFLFHKMDLKEAQANLSNAMEFFSQVNIKNHLRSNYETSIEQPDSFNAIKSYIEKYLVEKGWATDSS